MNFIQSGDWHIRIRPELPEDWQVLRYNRLAMEIIDLCRTHDAQLFLSGDIFDRNRPSLMELQLFIEILICISDAGIDTRLLAGNHEAIGQGRSTFDYLTDIFHSINRKGCGQIHYYPTLSSTTLKRVQFWFAGHPVLDQALLHADWVKSEGKPGVTRVLITHVRATINKFIREEVEIQRLVDSFDLVFASDIHDAIELHDMRLVYTDHPLNSTFEAKPHGGCLLITAEDGAVTWKRIPLHLPNLVQITTTADEYQEPTDDGNYFRVEIRGTAGDLREITSQASHIKLLKVPEIAETYTESEDAEEIKDQALEEALIEYMRWLQFDGSKIQDMMEVYREP